MLGFFAGYSGSGPGLKTTALRAAPSPLAVLWQEALAPRVLPPRQGLALGAAQLANLGYKPMTFTYNTCALLNLRLQEVMLILVNKAL